LKKLKKQGETEQKNIKYLSMIKTKEAKAYFDDGLWYRFEATQPKHIRFTISTNTEDREPCDFRLTKLMDKDAREKDCEVEKKKLDDATKATKKAEKKGVDRRL
jgi:hypothetical protein